jgi:hypothetical protein
MSTSCLSGGSSRLGRKAARREYPGSRLSAIGENEDGEMKRSTEVPPYFLKSRSFYPISLALLDVLSTVYE